MIDHPVRAFSEREHLFTARPPLLCKEGKTLSLNQTWAPNYVADFRDTTLLCVGRLCSAFSQFGVRPKELIKQGSDATENACTGA